MNVLVAAVVAVLGFCGILFVLRLSFPYLAPFIVGLFLAVLMDVPVSHLEARGWSRTLTSFVFAATSFLALPAILTMFLVRLWEEVQGLLSLGFVGQLSSMFSEQVLQFFERIPLLNRSLGQVDFLTLPQTLFKWALAIPDLMLIWTFAAFSAYFFCRDKKVLIRFIAKQIPTPRRLSVRRVYHDTSGALWHFIQVQLLLMLISTSVSMVFFCVLNLPYALLSGFLVGFFDLCPILGPGLVYFALALIQLWLGNTSVAMALGLGYLILLLLRQWGEPHLVSERLGLHPLVALIGLYAGWRFWGPLGAVVGPILMVFLKAFLRNYSYT